MILYQHFFLSLLIGSAVSYKVLIPLPFTFRSVSNFFMALANTLADNGHEVTFLTPYGTPKTQQNLRVHILSNELKQYDKYNFFELRKIGTDDFYTPENFINATNIFLADPFVSDLWTRRNHFDVILTDFYLQEMTFHFLIDYEGSFVQVCTTGMDPDCLRVLGNIASPAIIPHYFYAATFDHLSFWRRLTNFLAIREDVDSWMAETIEIVSKIVRTHYPKLEAISEYRTRTDLTLFNAHVITDYPVPLLPNQVLIGCLNCAVQGLLSQDLQKFIDGSDEGFIYFSLGGMANPKDIPPQYLKALIAAFKQLPQQIVMKFNTNETFGPNIMARNWLPQQDLLAHPKLRLFISHCGLQSVQEAQYHGAPILALPIILDQPVLADKARESGIAEVLEWEDLTVDLIVSTIRTMLNDPSYKKISMYRSKLMKDQTESASYRANWWIEYTVRHHKNTKLYSTGRDISALRYKGKELSVLQYLMVDVMLFVFCCCTLCLGIIVAVIKCIFCRNKKTLKSKMQ